MEIRGKVANFKKMLDVASLGGTFSELVIEVHNDKFLLIRCADGAGKTTISERGIFTGFDKMSAEKEMIPIGIKVPKLLSKLAFFDPEEIISITTDDQDLVVAGEQYVWKTSIYDPDAIKVYAKKLKFAIDDEKKIALYKKGEQAPTTIATIQSDILKKIAKLSVEVGQEYYPISLAPPNKIFCSAGSRKKDKTNDLVDFNSNEDVLVDGEEMSTTLGKGFKEVCSVLDGECQISGLNERIFGKAAPLWIYQVKDDYEIGFLIAPRVPE